MPDQAPGAVEAALTRSWTNYRALLKTCRSDRSEIAVHDLRVGARRMLGALDVIRPVKPRPPLGKLRRSFRGVLDALDDLRDVQVMLLELSRIPESLPRPAGLMAELDKRERRMLRKSAIELEAVRPSRLRKRIRKLRHALREESSEGQTAAISAVDKLFDRAAEAAVHVDDQDEVSIHRARIAFKRFRYAAEMIDPLLPPHTPDLHKRMHSFQSTLGDIRDLDILLAAIARFNRKHPAGPDSAGPSIPVNDALRRSYQERRLQHVAAFHAAQGELATYWRPDPDHPFPWEGNHDSVHRSPRDRLSNQPGGR